MASTERVKVSLYDHPFSPRGGGGRPTVPKPPPQPHPPERSSLASQPGGRHGSARPADAASGAAPASAAAAAAVGGAGAGSVTPTAGKRAVAAAAADAAQQMEQILGQAIQDPVLAAQLVGMGVPGAASDPQAAIKAIGLEPHLMNHVMGFVAQHLPDLSRALLPRSSSVASDSSSSLEGMDRHAANDGPIPWGYRSGDSASTRALGRTFKYGDAEDLGASRIGFLMPKHVRTPSPPKKLDAAAVDANLESVVPMALHDAGARRAAEVDELLRKAVIALSSRPTLPSAAVKHLDAVVEANPHCQPALKLRAGAHCMLSHYAQALTDADAALYLAPMDEVSWLWKATAHDHMNEYVEAVDAYTSGLQYEPTNARLQKGYVAAVKRAEKAGNKRDTLRFRGSKTLRDSEYAFTPSQVSETAKLSTAKWSAATGAHGGQATGLPAQEEGISYEPADPVSLVIPSSSQMPCKIL